MNVRVVKSRSGRSEFLRFRRKIYSGSPYIDDNYFMLLEIFSGKLHLTQSVDFFPVIVSDEEDNVLCEGLVVFALGLPDCIQLCFFEALPDQEEAVKLLLKKACKMGRERNCSRLVIGLYGHVNYGLGLLASHFDTGNSFSEPGNPAYYIDYFRKAGCSETRLNSYLTDPLPEPSESPLKKYERVIRRLEEGFHFRFFDRKNFEQDSRIFTDLNNLCFHEHCYYYERDYEDDREMLKELFLFMKEDSLIYAFKGDKPAAFILWYPDFNELAKAGECFGTKHFFKNLYAGNKIRTAKVVEYGVIRECRGLGLPVVLIDKAYRQMRKHGMTRMESSWVLEENADSNSFCRAITDSAYKKYVVFEKEI
ncbi:MAG: hypothetical protein K6E50_02470 [Lachnospiraceae bacterium]|nr:hypothetical protein [Lachnospiraceae bacterium]